MNIEVMERRDKCVYVHKLDGGIVYVGSGTTERVNNKRNRSDLHLQYWPDLEKIIVANNLTENSAKDLEQKLLDKYWSSGLLLNIARTTNKVLNISWQEMDNYFCYDESSISGLTRKVRVANSLAGSVAGSYSKNGYYSVGFNNSVYYNHRIIYSIMNKIDLNSQYVIDHIDNNRKNNKIENLRLVSQSINCKNRKQKIGNLGEQGIHSNDNKFRFIVSCKCELVKYAKQFSYTPRPNPRSTNHYPTRELALEAAIAYRDTLVQQGLIVLT